MMLDGVDPECAQYLKSAIAAGLYENEADALNQAVELLQRRDAFEKTLQAASAEFAAGGGIAEAELFDLLDQTIEKIERSAPVESR